MGADDKLAAYVAADEAQNAELDARMAAWRTGRNDIANLDEWDKQAKRAVEWGIVYEHPEAIVALAAEVRRLRALVADVDEWAAAALEEDGKADCWVACVTIRRTIADA